TKGLLNFNDNDRISFLKEALHYDEKKIEEFKKILQGNKDKIKEIENKLVEVFGREKIKLNEATSLPDLKKVHR
ncbi:glycosyl transferase, partial [Vibrio parahaemolyticus]